MLSYSEWVHSFGVSLKVVIGFLLQFKLVLVLLLRLHEHLLCEVLQRLALLQGLAHHTNLLIDLGDVHEPT